MKRKLLVTVILALAGAAFGCASTPWLQDITGDPRLSDCCELGDPLSVRLAVAPAKMPELEESPAKETRERHPITAQPGQVREAIVASLGKFNIFSEVKPLDVQEPQVTDEAVMQAAEQLYQDLGRAGIEVLLDDRDERPGSKFKDADLLGIPLRVTVGSRGLKEQAVELQRRSDGERTMLPLTEAAERLVEMVRQALS